MILRAAALQPPVCWQEPGCTGVQSGFMLGEKVRQFAREYCYIDVTSGRQNSVDDRDSDFARPQDVVR